MSALKRWGLLRSCGLQGDPGLGSCRPLSLRPGAVCKLADLDFLVTLLLPFLPPSTGWSRFILLSSCPLALKEPRLRASLNPGWSLPSGLNLLSQCCLTPKWGPCQYWSVVSTLAPPHTPVAVSIGFPHTCPNRSVWAGISPFLVIPSRDCPSCC